MQRFLWICAFAVLLFLGSSAAPAATPWTPADQPGLADAVAQAKDLTVEELAVPVKTTQTGELMRAPNPDGKTYDLLQWYYRSYPGPTTVAIMDMSTGEVKLDSIPDKLQIHICGKALAPNGKLYFATPWGHYGSPQKGMEAFVYDPATNQLSSIGIVAPKLRGENRPMCVGADGKVYGTGSYPDTNQVGAYQIDPDTGAVTDYGPIGPSLSPNGCWAKSIAADDRYVYITTAHHLRHLVCLDRETRQVTVLATAENVDGSMGVTQGRYGCTASGVKVIGTDGGRIDYWLYKGQAIPKKSANEKPPWPEPEIAKPWVAMPTDVQVFSANALPKTDGSAEMWYRVGAEAEWKAFRYSVPTYPIRIGRIMELADGRIYGNAGAYTGNFIYDPRTGQADHLGLIHLSQYSAVEYDGKVYMSGYPSSPLYIYDLSHPWTANAWSKPGEPAMSEYGHKANPQMQLYLREHAGTHEMVSACVGPDNRIYFGGTWIRDGSGGGLAWWSPKEQKSGGFWKDFSNYRVEEVSPVPDTKLLVISTRAVRDSVLNKPTPAQGRVFFFDTEKQELAGGIDPLANAPSAGRLVGVPGGRAVGFAQDPDNRDGSVLYGIDAVKQDIVLKWRLPYTSRVADYRMGPDGRIWTYFGDALVRIKPDDLSVEVIGKVSAAGRLAFSGRDVYLSGAEQVRRIANVLPEK